MFINWLKLLFAVIYLFITIGLGFIQLLLPPTFLSIIITLILLITSAITSTLFASNIINAFSKPLETPNIIVSLAASVIAILLVLIQVYLFILRVIDWIAIFFPK